MGMLASLARVFVPRQKINPAGEGNWHPGPYTTSQGWLPPSWGQYLNFWQMDLDPLPFCSASIVEACVWAYIRAIAQLPGFHRRELGNGGTETITTSALARLLRSPNDYETPSDLLVHLIRSLLLNGNSYWIAQRNDRNEVIALHWTDPRNCRVREVAVSGQDAREIFYEISNNPLVNFVDDLRGMIVPARDVLHIKLACPRHPLIGETWLSALRPELTQNAAVMESGTNAAVHMRAPGIISTELDIGKPQLEELKAQWETAMSRMRSGGAPPILTRGLKFQPISLSAEDQKIIEQQKMNDAKIASVFGVPGILLGISDTATQKSAEEVMAQWLSTGLGFLINHIEVSFDKFVGLNDGSIGAAREYTEFDTRALLRSLFKDRIDGLTKAVQGGIYAPDEARALEGLAAAPKGAGKEPRVQQQLMPLSAVLEPPKPAPAPALPPPSDASPPDVSGQDAEAARAVLAFRLRKEIDHAIERRAA